MGDSYADQYFGRDRVAIDLCRLELPLGQGVQDYRRAPVVAVDHVHALHPALIINNAAHKYRAGLIAGSFACDNRPEFLDGIRWRQQSISVWCFANHRVLHGAFRATAGIGHADIDGVHGLVAAEDAYFPGGAAAGTSGDDRNVIVMGRRRGRPKRHIPSATTADTAGDGNAGEGAGSAAWASSSAAAAAAPGSRTGAATWTGTRASSRAGPRAMSGTAAGAGARTRSSSASRADS